MNRDYLLYAFTRAIVEQEWPRIKIVFGVTPDIEEVINEVYVRCKESNKSIGAALQEYLKEIYKHYLKEIPTDFAHPIEPKTIETALELFKTSSDRELKQIKEAWRLVEKELNMIVNRFTRYIFKQNHMRYIWSKLSNKTKKELKKISLPKEVVNELTKLRQSLKKELKEKMEYFLRVLFLTFLVKDRDKKNLSEEVKKRIIDFLRGKI